MKRISSRSVARQWLQGVAALATAAAMFMPTAASAGSTHSAAVHSGAVHPAKKADFNGDGFTDLAAGAPDSGPSQEGAVVVAYGSSTGIVSTGTQTWTLDSPGVPGTSAPNDFFGNDLTSADYNRDGYADLVIGVPFRTVSGHANGGEIVILRGSPGGITANKATVLTENSARVPGISQTNDYFAAALTSGDFNADGWADLAVSVEGKTVQGHPGAGAVDILYGGPDGLGSEKARMFTRATPGVAGDPVNYAAFGTGLAAGDVGKGGIPDLAVGAYGDRIGPVEFAGSVTVLYGSPNGLSAQGSQRWTPRSVGATDPSQLFQDLGWALTIGDFGKSRQGDLAIGAPGTDVAGTDGAGAAYVLFGSPSGLTAAGRTRLTQATPGMPRAPGAGDRLGDALAGADLDRSGRADLVIGAREMDEVAGGTDNAGGTYVVPGGPNGVRASAGKLFVGEQLVGHDVVSDLYSGWALSTGHFGRGRAADLAIGIPGEDAGGMSSAGAVAILFGGSQGVGTARMQLVDADTLPGFGAGASSLGMSLVDSTHVID